MLPLTNNYAARAGGLESGGQVFLPGTAAGSLLIVNVVASNNATALGFGSAATNASSAFDAAGAASTVQANLTTHAANTSNPHAVTKAQVGLSNVANVAALALAGGTVSGSLAVGGSLSVTGGLFVNGSITSNGNILAEAFDGLVMGVTDFDEGITVHFRFGGDVANEIENSFGGSAIFKAYHGTHFYCQGGVDDGVYLGRIGDSLDSDDPTSTEFTGFLYCRSDVEIDGTLHVGVIDSGLTGQVTTGTVTCQRLTVSGEQVGLVAKSSAYTATTSDSIITVTGNTTITLPAASGCKGQRLTVKKTDTSSTTTTIARTGSDTIDGSTSATITTQYGVVRIVSDGASHWWTC